MVTLLRFRIWLGKVFLMCFMMKVDFFRLSASYFLVFVPRKVTTTNEALRRRLTFRLSHLVAAVAKEEDTQPSRPLAPLRCSTK